MDADLDASRRDGAVRHREDGVDDVHAAIALTLRAATEADGPAIGAIKVDTWRRAYPGILPAPVLDGLDTAQESAEWGAELAGLYVHPTAQGTGAGRRMLAWLVGDLLARNLAPVVLWHFVGNERAAAVYAAAGFEPDGARRPVPGLDVDEVRLRLRPGLR